MAIVYHYTGLVGAGIKKAAGYIQSKLIQTDSDLIARAKDGDNEAFNELVRRYQDFVYKQAVGYLNDSDMAKDAAQEVFIKAYRGLPYFEGNLRFTAWLYRICKNHCLNVIRKLKIENETRIESENNYNPNLALNLKIKKLISKLNDDYREVIILRYYQNLKYEQIAEILTIPISTVKIRLYRAKNRLKEMIGKNRNEMR